MTASTYLPREFENTPQLLTLQVVNGSGFLKDAVLVEFRILDPTGTLDFPGADYEEVTTGTGHVGTGRYYAYDETNDVDWAPGVAATLGQYTIEWRWRIAASDDLSTWSEHFDVVEARSGTDGFLGFPYRTYVSPDEVRAEGLTDAQATDKRLENLIERAQSYVEDKTQNLFRPVHQELRLSGQNNDRTFLNWPVVGIESVKANWSDSVNVSDSSLVVAFNRSDLAHTYRPNPDHRRNPYIAFVGGRSSIFAPRVPSDRFAGGSLNQLVSGVWGFLESDGTVPRMIREAMVRLIFASSVSLAVPTSGSGPVGPLKSLLVDGSNRMEWAVPVALQSRSALSTSKEVEEILQMYRTPISLGSPASRFSL